METLAWQVYNLFLIKKTFFALQNKNLFADGIEIFSAESPKS